MVNFTQTFRIYETLHKYFRNEEDARALASGIEEMIGHRLQSEKERLATKMDIMELKGDLSQMRHRMKQSFRMHYRVLLIALGGYSLLVALLSWALMKYL